MYSQLHREGIVHSVEVDARHEWPEVRRVFVSHPIQDATDDEMRAKADAIVEQIIDALKQ